jgi:hypothetical protein
MADKTATPKAAAGDAKVANMTAGDSKFATILFKYLPPMVDIDWAAFAQEAGFKSVQVAKVCFDSLNCFSFSPLTIERETNH